MKLAQTIQGWDMEEFSFQFNFIPELIEPVEIVLIESLE